MMLLNIANDYLPDSFVSLEDAVSAFIQACEAESNAQFLQSDICAIACTEEHRIAWGMSDDDILRYIGERSDRSRTTMYARLLVGRVFPRHWREAPENAWCHTKSWSHFEICARTWSEDDPDAPYEWLSYCVENDLSVRQLRLEIQSARGELPRERPQYIASAVPCTVDYIDERSMTVYFDSGFDIDIDGVRSGDRVVITVVKESERPMIVDVDVVNGDDETVYRLP